MKEFAIIFFLIISIAVKAQDIHVFLEPDTVPNCSILKEGKFLDSRYNQSDYYLIVNDSTETEYLDNGNKYVRHKINWLSDCTFELTTIENQAKIPSIKIGSKTIIEIIETQREYVKIQGISEGDTASCVMVKISAPYNDCIQTTDTLRIDELKK